MHTWMRDVWAFMPVSLSMSASVCVFCYISIALTMCVHVRLALSLQTGDLCLSVQYGLVLKLTGPYYTL